MATLTKGQTFLANDTVTASKLHALVDNATLSAVVNADIDDSAAIVDTKLATISTAGKVSATSIVDLASLPAGAGVIPSANLGSSIPVKATGAEIDTGTDDAKFVTPKAIADSALASETAWTDYSATSTIVGFSSFSIKAIYTKKIGKTVFVKFSLAGTSNSTGFTFTVPYTGVADPSAYVFGIASDNSGANNIIAIASVPSNTNVVNCYADIQGSAWTASNVKSFSAIFFYEAA